MVKLFLKKETTTLLDIKSVKAISEKGIHQISKRDSIPI